MENKDKTVKGHDVSKCTMRLNGALFYIFTVIYFFYNGKSMLLILLNMFGKYCQQMYIGPKRDKP